MLRFLIVAVAAISVGACGASPSATSQSTSAPPPTGSNPTPTASAIASATASAISTAPLASAPSLTSAPTTVAPTPGATSSGAATSPSPSSSTAAPSPTAPAGTGIAAVALGYYHACALTIAGAVECWGWNDNGQLGDGTTTDSLTPVAVSGLEPGITAIAANTQFTCALTSAGGVMCWGFNLYGQLGDGKEDDSSTPVAVSGLESGVTAITAGDYHVCALLTSGGVVCWGDNDYGQLGDGSTKQRSKPVSVTGIDGPVAAVSAGYQHTCVLTTAGAVECWGVNDFGTLGDGTNASSFAPVAVSGLTTGVTAISAGDYHTCALTGTGQLMCWGANDYGQVGDGTNESRSVPVPVSSLGSGVSAVTAGYQFTCAITDPGPVMCWGNNDYGQLGDGTKDSNSTPSVVSGL